jgi:4-amino-4-deoxy-L-arabinose transferase-like glycosyltransferase
MTTISTVLDAPTPPTDDPPPSASPARRIWRPADQPAWARPALAVLLLATAVLYLWGLGASGWANSFYSAAAQAGSESWKAFFFGSSDAGNSITVDKTPASLWLMALSVRLFGLSSWSILVPQALAGVATVGVLYAAVRRTFGPAAGLLAGAVVALTPVAVLMFRFNNPDALLVLLLTLAGYAGLRAVERASTRWLVLAGVLVGFGYLTKMLQAFLVVPALALAYLVAAPTSLRRRLGQLALAGLAMVASAGWWVAIVELLPAAVRPYIGGSQTNSILELTFGYNGLGRITGDEVGSVGGGFGGGQGGRWGETGWLRLFNADNGGQISWLLPAALILLGAGLALTARAPRTDRTRAAFLLWGGWLVGTAVTFSLMAGIFHAYYDVALAPALGALVGMGAAVLWRRRDTVANLILAATVAVTAVWSWVLLGRSADWQPWLRPLVLVVGLAAAVGLAAGVAAGRWASRVAVVAAVAGIAVGLAGPAAYAIETAATAHSGAIPSAGPAVAGAGFGGRGGPGGGPVGAGGPGGGPGTGTFPDGRGPGAAPGAPAGAVGPDGGRPGPGGTGRGGGAGGLLDATTPGSQLAAMLTADADRYTWVAATVGANNAAGYQLATGRPVMPLGGFNGSDPSPTLAQFQQYVSEGRIHYFLGGAGFQSNGGSREAQQIAAWVAEHFAATTVNGVTVYDLTG